MPLPPRVNHVVRSTVSSHVPKLLLLGSLLGAAQGCAFSNINVSPPPAATLEQPSTLGRGRTVALSTPLTDARPMRERCGMQKNGYNMDTADVHCTTEPAGWMTEALSQGLTSAGFRVVPATSAQAAGYAIEGSLLQFFVEPKVGAFTFTPEADISLRLVVTSPSGLRAERIFYVKGYEKSLVGTERNFQRAAQKATERAVADMVAAIASLLDRYPDGGASRLAAVAVAAPSARLEVAR